MLFPTHQDINRFIHGCPMFLGTGAAILISQFLLPVGWKIGFLTGFTLFASGIFGFALRRWRTEQGLWMLACLLTAVYFPSIAYFEFLHWREIAQLIAAGGGRWPQFRLTIDATISLLIASYAVKLIAGIAIENFRITHN